MSKKIIIEEEKIFDENGDITINAEVKIDEFIAFICDYCQNNNISPTILDLSCIEILKRNIFALKIIFDVKENRTLNEIISKKQY